MNRKDILQWIKTEICPQLDLSQKIDIATTIKIIGKFRAENHVKVSEQMTAEVNEYGYLFINGQHAGQITNKIPRAKYYPDIEYWEGKILARQEAQED